MKLNPGWAPSYLTNLEGIGSEHLQWERRGIRGEWYILKIKKLLDKTRPRYGKIGLDLEVECDITPLSNVWLAQTKSLKLLKQ
jgi:hypothetical protein